MSNSRSPTTITCAAVLRSSPAAAVASSQRKDSFSSMAWDLRSAAGLSRRVQMRACTTPSNASSSASTATVAWQKNPGVFPSPAGPRPRRPPLHPLKLISVVSCGTTIRLPAQAPAVLVPAVLTISSGVTCGDPRKLPTDTCPIPIATDSAQNHRPSRDDPFEHHRSNCFPPHIAEMTDVEFRATVHCRLPGHCWPEQQITTATVTNTSESCSAILDKPRPNTIHPNQNLASRSLFKGRWSKWHLLVLNERQSIHMRLPW